jgi:serine/threonine protein kinase
LIDFGRSKVIGEVGYSTALLAGSAAYMAPELFPTGEVNIDELFSTKSDVYAFGMFCFEVSYIFEENLFSYKLIFSDIYKRGTIRELQCSSRLANCASCTAG